MEIELVPDRGPDDPATRAAVEALLREGLAGDRLPGGSTGAWRRAGLEDAIDRTLGASADALATPPGDELRAVRRGAGTGTGPDSGSRA